MEFESNIAQDNRFIKVSESELSGVKDDFLKSLKKDQDGKYIVGIDYPTYFHVMENCHIESTRKALWTEFVNRGYPKNKEVLIKVISLRNELAELLGYKNFAELDLDDQMAKSPEVIREFLEDIFERCKPKVAAELTLLKKDLPSNITLKDDQFNPWDFAFVKNSYKKKYFSVDEADIAQYFPLENTVEKLLEIYQKFMGLSFEQCDLSGLWHNDLKLVKVCRDGVFAGYLILDLFPRANKFSHACQDHNPCIKN